MDRFWRVAASLAAAGVRVPAAHVWLPELKLGVISDLGSLSLCELIPTRSRDPALIRSALEPLGMMRAASLEPVGWPYDPGVVLADFTGRFIRRATAAGWSRPRRLPLVLRLLWCRIQEWSPVGLVHADYHGRNLVYDEDGIPGVIDFQDAAIGPLAVDWAAIVYDHNRSAMEESVELWEREAALLLRERSDREGFVRLLRHAGLFWHIRLAGMCTRLCEGPGGERFRAELKAVRDWLRLLADLPELQQFRPEARAIAAGLSFIWGDDV